MRRRRARAGATRGALLLAALVASLAGAAEATAAIRPWPGGVVSFHVASPSLRAPVLQAAREWNTSGARVHLVERPAASARLVVRAMPRRACFGVVGFAPLGELPPGYRGTILLQPGCGRFTLIAIAAHELGHVLGLGHDDRHCSVMNSVGDLGCRDVVYPWEYRCHPLEIVDVRRAVALYGGRPRRPARSLCLSQPTPAPARAAGVQANPAGSLATARITWRNPPSSALRRVVINRRAGNACPTYPSIGNVLVPARVAVRDGEVIADMDARAARGQRQEAFDLADLAPGRWCYAVWAMGPNRRYARAAMVRVVHPGPDRSPARIGLTAVVAPAPGVRARLTWTNPTAPIASSVVVLRATGPCPADPADLRASTVATVATTPGPVTVDDADPTTPGGTWCYAVAFQDATTFTERRVLLEVPGVPEPIDVPPTAAFTPTLAEGSIAAGTNAIRFVDGSSDADGTIVAWAWSLGDGTTSADRDVDHTYLAAGSYAVTLTVTDDHGAVGTATGTVVITP